MFCKYCGQRIDDDSVFCSGCGRALGAAPNAKTSVGNNVTVQTGYSPLSNTRTASRPIWRTLYFVVFGLWALSAILMCVDWFSIDILGRSVSGNVFSVLKLNEAMEDSGMFNSGSPLEDIATVIIIGLVISIGLVIASIILFVKDKKVCCITGIAASAVMIFFSAVTIASANDLPYYYAGIFELTSAPTFLLIVSIAAVILLIASFVKNPDKIHIERREKRRVNYFFKELAVSDLFIKAVLDLFIKIEGILLIVLMIIDVFGVTNTDISCVLMFSLPFYIAGLVNLIKKDRELHKSKWIRLMMNFAAGAYICISLGIELSQTMDNYENVTSTLFIANGLFVLGYGLVIKLKEKKGDLLGSAVIVIAAIVSFVVIGKLSSSMAGIYFLFQLLYSLCVCTPVLIRTAKTIAKTIS